MVIDFKKKLASRPIEPKTNPIELYDTLDRKSVAGPLRPSQKAILSDWYENHRYDKDLIIKMHTGEGKTLVGLLLLQSLLNLKEGPCLYVCPNKYLVNQVCSEADKFGIPFCTFDDADIPNDFLSASRILITHVQKVFNGRSVFGTGNDYLRTGAIMLDDSHACIDTIKNAFTVSISRDINHDVYWKIMTLFDDDMENQGEGSWLDIKAGDFDTFMAVPYWSWDKKRSEVLTILSEMEKSPNNSAVYYTWPLIRNQIGNYCCYISGTKIEIVPYNINIRTFGSFSCSKHRVLMSATTQDDSFFVKGLGFTSEAVKNPLRNKIPKWSGERMLIIPSLTDECCDHDLIVAAFGKKIVSKYGMVALVPSTRKSQQYQDLGAIVTNSDNLICEIEKLKKGTFSRLVVLNNRYDGVDLPDESCRVLIMDGLPYFDSLADRYEEQACPNSELINKRIAQKIEQGIGRGVRGEKDYCAVLIIGSDLVRFMRSITTNKFFSAQTKKQIDIGIDIADMIKEDSDETDSPINIVHSLIDQMLTRDEGWKSYYTSEMEGIEEEKTELSVYDRLQRESLAEQFFCDRDYEKALSTMQSLIDEFHGDDAEKGWYLQQLARYTYPIGLAKSIELQKAAFKKNPQLLKPSSGIDYKKISYISQNRLNNIRSYMRRFQNYNELSLNIDAILGNLSFGVEAAKFESALKDIGDLLGYISQRPDKEIRKGPDNLWCGSNNHFLLFECKSNVSENSHKEITKYEAGQMNNHCAWFDAQYGKDVKVDRFIIIPTRKLSYEGDFSHDVRVIRRNRLKALKEQIKGFIKDLKPYKIDEMEDDTLQEFLTLHYLNIEDFREQYSEEVQ